MWIDSHSHVQFRQFENDVENVIERAVNAGVGTMVVVGIDLASSRKAVETAERFGLYATVGVHPHDAAAVDDETVAELHDLAAEPRVVAIGEIGLDYARDYSPRQAQKRVFRDHLKMAAALKLPVVVHCRDADADLIDILDEMYEYPAGGVLHCFSGDERLAERAGEWGFHVSAAGHITRPANGPIRDALATVPLDMLLVETDCPYLLPVTVKRKGLNRNEPAFVPAVGERLAEIKNVSKKQIERVTTANAIRLFGLDIDTAGE